MITKFILISCLILFVLFRLFLNLDTDPIARWDEETNAQVVLELVNNSSFPYLTLNTEPFFEKPPLWYYITADIVKNFGYNNFTLRIVSAVSGLLLFLLTAVISWKWYGPVGSIVSIIVLATTEQLFINNVGGYFSTHTLRSADSDALQILFLIASMYCFGLAQANIRTLYLGFVFSGLAFLTKGPVGLLPPLVYIIYMLSMATLRTKNKEPRNKPSTKNQVPRTSNQFSVLSSRSWVSGFLLFCLIVLPWYIVMFRTFGFPFLQEHFGYHMIKRVAEPLEGHSQEWWFYLEFLFNKKVYLWTWIFIASLIFLIEKSKHSLKEYKTFAPLVFVVSLLLITTLTHTKLAWYILPIYPFIAVFIGNAFQELYNHFISGKI